MKRNASKGRVASIRILLAAGAVSTSAAYAETWRVVPSITINETLTDNVALAPSDRKESDLITQITPAIRATRTGGRLQFNVNYRMNNILYANESDRNRIQNYLNAVANFEAVENWLFVDATGAIAQQAISAFGAQPNTENINDNRTETSTYTISPYITGRLAGSADYHLRYRWGTTQGRSGPFSDTQASEVIGTLGGSTGWRTLGWQLNASHQNIDRGGIRDLESSRVGGSLIYQVDPQFRVRAIGGYETNNYSFTNRSSTNYGGGVEWAPTERTQLNALVERRFLGNSREFLFSHRTRLTAWRFTDRRGVVEVPVQIGPTTGSTFDVLFNALASRIPDPIERAEEVERLIRVNGLPASFPVAGGFVTNQVTIQESQQASVAILGARNTVTLLAGRTESESLGVASGLTGDFSATSTVEQRSVGVNWSHRLSAFSSLSLFGSQIKSIGSAESGLNSTQRTLRLLFTHQLGSRTYGTLGARWVRFDSTSAPDYSEKALTASLSVTF